MSIIDEVAQVPEDVEETELPKLYLRCMEVYNAMLSKAVEQPDESVVWEGHLVNFVDVHAKVKQSQYSRVVGMLTDMQCIVQLRRGSGNIPSKWAMLGPPTIENYEYQRRRQGYKRERKKDPKDQLAKDMVRIVNDLVGRVETLESMLGIKADEDWGKMFRDVRRQATQVLGETDGKD